MAMNKNILIVEDEGILALQVKNSLMQMGYNISAIYDSGEKSIEGINASQPDLILMDIKLKGGMDGIETAELIHKQYDIPIIFMTAHSEANTIERAKLTNPYAYLLKPVNSKELQIAVEVALYKSKIDKDLKAQHELTEHLNKKLQEATLIEHKHRLEKEEMLVQQSKIAAMGEMIGAIAHQWRQPLNNLGLVVQSLQDSYEHGGLDKTLIDKTVTETMNQITFMSKTIDDFRDFMNPSKNRQTFDLKVAAGEIFTLLSAQMKNNYIACSITCHVHNKTFTNFDAIETCGECEITSYKNEFKQVILNLITNAKDAIFERRAKGLMRHSDEGRIDIDFYSKNNKIIIEMSDNGGGMSEEYISKIFEPYFTTKGEGKGTGMGLYMSRTIIDKNMGGKLSVANIEGGAKFTIEFNQS